MNQVTLEETLKTHKKRPFHNRRLSSVVGALAVLALTTACAGAAGDADSTSSADEMGFEYGAPQEEVDAAIESLEPVEIVFQGNAASPNSEVAKSDKAFAETVETRSNGQISVEVLYGQPVAGYEDIYDALVDGRVDISFAVPGYDPQLFPAFNDLVSITGALPSSPIVGELASLAVLTEMAWESEAIKSEFADQGLMPLAPVSPSGGAFPLCNEDGSGLDDWQGRQVRVGSTIHSDVVVEMGGTPVSMEYGETYEALQRGTIDCTIMVFLAANEAGMAEVAPNIQFSKDQSLPRGPGSMLAGSKVSNMPLAYQQIIFDSWQDSHGVGLEAIMSENMKTVESALDSGGKVTELDPEVEELIRQSTQQVVAAVSEDERLGSNVDTKLEEKITSWTQIVEELGYEDQGSMSDLPEWFDAEEFDSQPFIDRLYDDVVSNYRPETENVE